MTHKIIIKYMAGLYSRASKKLKLMMEYIALDDPQKGHGIPMRKLRGQKSILIESIR